MTPENIAKLTAICPQAFRDLGDDIECGDGWFQPLADLCTAIQKILDANPKLTSDRKTAFCFSQIKEKFGGLRVYCYGANEEIFKRITDAEVESYKTCEQCGSRENVGTTVGWIKSLCDQCMAAAGKKRYVQGEK